MDKIPKELLERPQWAAAGPDKMPIDPKTGRLAKVNDPSTWGTYEKARSYGSMYVGYMLSLTDPYAIIDLDDKPNDPASDTEKQRFAKIVQSFDSYTELSSGGRGAHIVIRGRMPQDAGRKRGHVEAYSTGRFMIFTGRVINDKPINDRQELLNHLALELSKDGDSSVIPIELDETRVGLLNDQELLDMALNASNGEKFDELCRGDWQAMGYESQSHADYALLSMLAYYTPDNEQVRRLFRMSLLGRRDKATQNNVYLDRSLKKIRSKEAPPVDTAALLAAPSALAAPTLAAAPPNSIGASQPVAAAGGYSRVPRPPGLLGELMDYVFTTSVRPLEETALVTAMGLLGGICGRSFNISNVGLNQYIVFIAPTGVGKSDISSSMERAINAVRNIVPMADQYIGPGAFASGQALVKLLDSKPCFVSVLGEFGITMQALNDTKNTNNLVLKKVLLDLYMRSGWGNILRGTVYSDQLKNTKDVASPAVTILGESTPEEFYASVDAATIASGFLPRFSIIEYVGDKPKRNKNAGGFPSQELTNRLADLITQVLTMTHNGSCYNIPMTTDAEATLDAFDEFCDDHVNSGNRNGDKAEVQIWSRGHLKALKLAGLAAVGLNFQAPVVDMVCAKWAIDFVHNDARIIINRLRTGDIGQGEVKQETELRRIIEAYLSQTALTTMKSMIDPVMHAARVIPYDFIRRKARTLNCFKTTREGATVSIQNTIKQMVEVECLQQFPTMQAKEQFGTRAPLYALGKNW